MAETYVPPDPLVVPYLMVHDGPVAVEWYVRALAAIVEGRWDEADGRLGHASLRINGGMIYLSDEFPEVQDQSATRAPRSLGGTTVGVSLAVDDVDAWMTRATSEGANTLRPATDEFYGRHGKVLDPFGHVWSFIGPKTGI